MNSDDPWKDIRLPNIKEVLSLRRVDACLKWDFFWGRSANNHCLLALRHRAESQSKLNLPNLSNLELIFDEQQINGKTTLILKLLDDKQRDLFLSFCLDIIESTKNATSENQAVALTVGRTWRWHHLLRSGVDQQLSLEEQKGLVGELVILQDTLLPILSPVDAVSAWSGPLGYPKDFQCNRVCIESKARGGEGKLSIKISTEHQLETNDIEALFLFVRVVDKDSESKTTSFTITELARDIFNNLFNKEPLAAILLEERLMSSGFLWEHDYTDYKWILGNVLIFHVTNDFPRIVASKISQGISKVRYELSLTNCDHFRTSDEVVKNKIIGS